MTQSSNGKSVGFCSVRDASPDCSLLTTIRHSRIIMLMQTVIEMPEFIRQAKQLGLSDDEREGIIDEVAEHPDLGDEISGTGGMRKLRVAARGKGKSGGYRVITFFSGENIPVFLITIYSKSQKTNITDKEKNNMKSFSTRIKNAYMRKMK